MKKTLALIINLLFIGAIFSCKEEETEKVQNQLGVDEFKPEQALVDIQGTPKTGYLDGQKIYYIEHNGKAIWQGDIVLSLDDISQDPTSDKRTEGTGRSNLATRWPANTVFYVLDPSLTNIQRQWINDAINHYQTRTRLRFELRSNQTNYIRILNGTGCHSTFLGMRGGEQQIELGGCAVAGSTIHEIGHAIGLHHEQCRADRDNFLDIREENIEQTQQSLYQFRTYNQQGSDGFDHGTLDLTSIMMYGSFAFSRNGLPTITRLDGSTFQSQRTALSLGDLACINYMYHINWAGTEAMASQNGSVYIVQNDRLHKVDVNGNYVVLGGPVWPGTEAMTSMNNFLYIVENDRLHKVFADGSYQVLGAAVWGGTEGMTNLNGKLYIVQNQRLHKVNEDGTYTVLGGAVWGETEAMTTMGNYIYIVQNDRLHRVDESGNYVVLGGAVWGGTEAMTSLNGFLYIVQNQRLHRVDGNGIYTVLGGPAWGGTEAMTTMGSHLYITQNSRLHRVNADGTWVQL